MFSFLKRLFVKTPVFAENEEYIYSIISKLLMRKDTICLTAPLSHRYYLQNERLHYYVRITDFEVVITNSKFNYNLVISSKFSEHLLKLVAEHIEGERQIFDSKAFQNEVDLLKNIDNSIQ